MDRQKLEAIAQELLRREEEKKKNLLETYNRDPNKLHLKQIDFHKSTKRNRWNFGGNRTGKTVSGAVEAVWYTRGNHPYKKIKGATSGWVVSLTNEVQRDVAQKEILRWLNSDWIVNIGVRKGKIEDLENAILDYIHIKNIFGTVSRIGFKSCEQGRSKFQGTSLDFIWFDEEPPEDIYRECQMRVMDTQGDIWGTMTPLLGLTWVYDEIYLNVIGNPEIEYRFFQWEDNPYLSREEIDWMIQTLPEKEREARQYGKFLSGTSALFGDFRKEVHVIEPIPLSPEWRYYFACDYGFDMAAGLWFAVLPGKEVVCYREVHVPNLLISEFCELILEMETFDPAGTRYIRFCPPDFRKRSHKDGETWMDTFFQNGVKLLETSNKREFGWSCVRELLRIVDGIPKLKIYSCCKVLISHMEKAQADVKNPDDIKDETEGDHFITHILDALRYFCISFYTAPRAKKEKLSPIQKYKRKLEKKYGYR